MDTGAIITRDGAVRFMPDGRIVTDRNGAPCCCGGGGGPCPFYWRAEHCFLVGCFVYICSDALCTNGEPLADGTVFSYQGQCYKVSTAAKYVPNPYDGSPPPDGFLFIPPLAAVVPDKTVPCKGKCGDCEPGNCSPPDCISRPQFFGPFNPYQKPECKGTWVDCCCDKSGKVTWSGYAEEWSLCPGGLQLVGKYEWEGSVTGFPADQNKPAHELFHMKRTKYLCNGTEIVDHFYIDGDAAGGVCDPVLWDARNYGWTRPTIEIPKCSFSHTCNSGALTVDWAKDKFRESFSRTPGTGKCGPQCPGGRIKFSAEPSGPVNPSIPGVGNPGVQAGGCGGCGEDGGAGIGAEL